MSRPVPHCQDALRWLKNRGWSLAPLTGEDTAALRAIAHCWELWVRSGAVGQRAAINAAAALLDGCQEVVWPMARELVAHAADWSHREQVWDMVVTRFANRPEAVAAASVARINRLERCHVGLPQVQP